MGLDRRRLRDDLDQGRGVARPSGGPAAPWPALRRGRGARTLIRAARARNPDITVGFEPLRFLPPGKSVGLGLVSTKTPERESEDELRRRIDQAARYAPLEPLTLGTQCGFASTANGDLLTVDDQRRKLELVVQTAQKVWG